MGLLMALAPIVAWALYNLYQVQPTFSHEGFSGMSYHLSVRITAAAIVLACPGALLWLAGWVVDGFGKESK
jgi:hypothetical protein